MSAKEHLQEAMALLDRILLKTQSKEMTEEDATKQKTQSKELTHEDVLFMEEMARLEEENNALKVENMSLREDNNVLIARIQDLESTIKELNEALEKQV